MRAERITTKESLPKNHYRKNSCVTFLFETLSKKVHASRLLCMQAGCFACCFKVRYFNFLPSSVWRRAWGGHVIPGSLGANLSMPAGGPTALLGHLWTMMGAKARLSPGMMSIHRVRGNIPSSLHANRSTHQLFLVGVVIPFKGSSCWPEYFLLD